MIVDVGLIVAGYCITRFAQMLGQPRPQASRTAKVLAGINIAVTLILALDLAAHGSASGLAVR